MPVINTLTLLDAGDGSTLEVEPSGGSEDCPFAFIPGGRVHVTAADVRAFAEALLGMVSKDDLCANADAPTVVDLDGLDDFGFEPVSQQALAKMRAVLGPPQL